MISLSWVFDSRFFLTVGRAVLPAWTALPTDRGIVVMLSRAFVTCIGRAVAIVVIAAFPFQKSATATELLKNCSPLASQFGAENVWFGHACGRSSSTANPWAEMGCFSTEADCRNWLLKSIPGSKPTSLLSCRRGAPKWSMRSQTD